MFTKLFQKKIKYWYFSYSAYDIDNQCKITTDGAFYINVKLFPISSLINTLYDLYNYKDIVFICIQEISKYEYEKLYASIY